MASTGISLVYVRVISHVMSLSFAVVAMFHFEAMFRMNVIFVIKYFLQWSLVTLDQDKILHLECLVYLTALPEIYRS